jgi:molybdenum cofactor biosynthesis enzyme MoaA
MDILQIEPTRRCNKNCKTCVRDNLDQIGEISIEKYKEILEINKNEHFDILKLQGLGEPFLYSDIDKLTQIARKYNYDNIMTITNGSFPIIGNFDRVVFSINRFGVEEKVLTNLFDAKRRKYNISINCVLTDQTKKEINELREVAERINVHIDFTPLEVWYGQSHPNHNTQYEMAKLMYSRFELKPDSRIKNCEWCINSLYYDYLGRLHPCCIRMTDEYIVNEENIDNFNFIDCCCGCPL